VSLPVLAMDTAQIRAVECSAYGAAMFLHTHTPPIMLQLCGKFVRNWVIFAQDALSTLALIGRVAASAINH